MSETRDGAIDTGFEVAKSLAEEGGDVALDLMNPMTRVVMGLASRRRKRIVDKLVLDVMRLLAHDDGEMSAQRVEEIRNSPGVAKFDEAITQGLQLVLTACDEVARDCISLLVADYARGLHPNRDYQLAGKLLVESDEIMLRHLERISRMYVAVLDGGGVDSPDRALVETPVEHAGEKRVWVIANSIMNNDGSHHATPPETRGDGLEAVVSALQRHDFGIEPGANFTEVPAQRGKPGTPILSFKPQRHDRRMRALYTYLQPVRRHLGMS